MPLRPVIREQVWLAPPELQPEGLVRTAASAPPASAPLASAPLASAPGGIPNAALEIA